MFVSTLLVPMTVCEIKVGKLNIKDHDGVNQDEQALEQSR